MKNTVETIKETAYQIALNSKLNFLKRDIESVFDKYDGMNTTETIKKLEKVFINANYAGDYKAGEFSFILKAYLRRFDITSDLNQFQIH